MSRRSGSLVFDHGGLAVDGGREQTAQGIGSGALLVDLPDDRRRGLVALGGLLERLDLLRRVGTAGLDSLAPQRPLDRHLPVAEGGIGEDLRLLGLLERDERVADALDVFFRQLAVFLAEVLA